MRAFPPEVWGSSTTGQAVGWVRPFGAWPGRATSRPSLGAGPGSTAGAVPPHGAPPAAGRGEGVRILSPASGLPPSPSRFSIELDFEARHTRKDAVASDESLVVTQADPRDEQIAFADPLAPFHQPCGEP